MISFPEREFNLILRTMVLRKNINVAYYFPNYLMHNIYCRSLMAHLIEN